MNTAREHAIALLKFTRSVSESFMKDFPAEQATHQPSPTDNHALWVLGHLAATDRWVANLLNIPGAEVPESFEKLFGMGSKPSSDPKQYPPFAEVKRAFESARPAILKWFETATESALSVDLKDKTGGFTSDPVDCMFKIAWHEGWHMGQLASVRKALGLPSVMG